MDADRSPARKSYVTICCVQFLGLASILGHGRIPRIRSIHAARIVHPLERGERKGATEALVNIGENVAIAEIEGVSEALAVAGPAKDLIETAMIGTGSATEKDAGTGEATGIVAAPRMWVTIPGTGSTGAAREAAK